MFWYNCLVRIVLAVTAFSLARPLISETAARLALRGPVFILDGSNSVDAFAIARSLRRKQQDFYPALERIQVARAFTCYQMASLIRQTPGGSTPKIILGLLNSFYDEDVRLADALRLFDQAEENLKRLAQTAPILVTSRPPGSGQAERQQLYLRLMAAADQTIVLDTPETHGSSQLALF